MKHVDPRFLREVINFCLVDGRYTGIQDALRKLGSNEQVSDGKVFFTLPEAQEIADLFVAHGLPRSADILLEWTGQDVRSRKLTPETVMSDLQRSIERELRSNLFLHVGENERRYYEGRHQFGEGVAAAFPSAVIDIEEAGKCYALSRYTACVFHLMRVMESALRVLASTLND
ncbi:MAG TPA: hypothetical protein VNW71_07310, partial [Thermoanaerobaculia bacterium]|nr:hypothetical protein [Thermoanaerobaculia bacterium]